MTITGVVADTGRFSNQFGRIHYLIRLVDGQIIYCPNTKKVDNAVVGGCDALKGKTICIETVPHPKYPKLVDLCIVGAERPTA